MTARPKPEKAQRLYLPLLLLAFLTAQGLALELERGTITGTVKDTAGKILSGVRMTLTAMGDSASSVTGSTDAQGRYKFEAVKPGKYEMAAELAGFRKTSRRDVELSAGETVVWNLTLEPVSKPGDGQTAAHGDPALGEAGYFDRPQLKSGQMTGSIDPGGYSAPGDAERAHGLLQGAARLRNDGGTTNAGRDPARDLTKDPKLEPVAIEQNLRKALEASPESFEANYNLGEFYIHAGKLGEAIPNLEKACRLNSSHYVSAYDLALAYLETGNYAAARKHLQAMLERQDAAELHDLLAEVEEKSGNYVEAANEYERAAHLEPTEQHMFDWGVELLMHQTLDPAIKVFESGVERYPRSARLLIGLGIALYSRGQYDRSVEALSRATDLEPADPRPYLFLAKMYNISSAEAAAVSDRLRRFAELQPRNPQSLYYYALSLWRGERETKNPAALPQIEKLLKESARLDPRFPDAHLQLGILYAERKDYAEAIAEYEQAIRLEPHLADAHYRLGQAYTRRGEKERAQSEFEIYERLHRQQQAEAEKQRAEIQQFVYTFEDSPK